MSDPIEQMVSEIRDRVVRMESRMVMLGDFVGANLRTRQRIDVVPGATLHGYPRVNIDSLDVSLSRILQELQRKSIPPNFVDVYHNDIHVFTIYPESCK